MRWIVCCLLLAMAIPLDAGELQDAAAVGDLNRVRSLVEGNAASVNARDRGTTALHEAARAGHLEVAQFLVSKGANLNANDISGATPLRLAIGYRRTDVAQFLRSRGALERASTAPARTPATPADTAPKASTPPAITSQPQKPPVASRPSGTTNVARSVPPAAARMTNRPVSEHDMMPVLYPIHEAARVGDVEHIKLLFKNFPELVNSSDEKGYSPLHVSVSNNQFQAAQVLLGLRANANARSDHGQTPLHLAARAGNLAMLELLLTNRAEINARDTYLNTPLLLAVQAGPDEGLHADLLIEEKLGQKAPAQRALLARLHQAQIGLVRLLISRGADVNARNKAGSSPLLQAVRLRNESVVELLLGAGANPDLPDESGMGVSTLHVAAGRGEIGIARLLLNRKANVNSLDARGETPLCYALRENRKEMAALLKQFGGTVGPERPLRPIEASLVEFFRKTELALQKGNASDKARTILSMTPNKAEIARMFPKHADIAWKVVEQVNQEVRETFRKPVSDGDAGREIWRIRVEPPSLLTQDWRDRGWIASDIPVFALVVDKVGMTSRPGDYCYVNQRWVMMPPLRAITAAGQQQSAQGK